MKYTLSPYGKQKTMKSTNSQPISECKSPRLRVGLKDVSREEFAAAVQEKLGKQRVSIMLDTAVIAFFKARAGGERGYQTLINQALRDAIKREEIEVSLRRVIREELRREA
jgi:uncharacterized protein (DUF4415 family)